MSIFEQSLEVMYKGMLAIFIALGIIFLFILLLNFVSKYMNERKEKNGRK